VALDEGHDDEVLPAGLAELVHGDDPGMIELGGRLSFLAEAVNGGGRCQLGGENGLSATTRPRLSCRALYTRPMPPRPTSSRIVYTPRLAGGGPRRRKARRPSRKRVGGKGSAGVVMRRSRLVLGDTPAGNW
jgi:hypothetical protein